MTNVPTAINTPSIPKIKLSGQDVSFITTDTWVTDTWVATDTSWITEVPPDYPLQTKPLICERCGAPMGRKDKCEYCDTKYI